MTQKERLKEQLAGLQQLALLQRGLRLGLRALWLGIGGALLAWSANALWGWPSQPAAWFLVGLLFALVPIAAYVISLKPRSRWVWTLDQRLGLQEQVSTAWQVVQHGQESRLSDALVQDVLAILPQVRDRMMKHGWFLARDVVATLIVALLGFLVLTSALMDPSGNWVGEAPKAVIPPLTEPQPPERSTPEEQAPAQDGSPGQGEQPGSGQAEGEPPGENPELSSGSDPSNSGALADVLRRLGSDLSEQAGTYDLGQALERLDLDQAAGEMENLSDQLDDLSPESLENLEQALQDAAGALEEAGESSLAQDLRGASEALQGQGEEPGEALDQLAEGLRQLAEEMEGSEMAGAGAGAGDEGGGSGRPEPLNRLEGEGGDLELPLEDSSQSGLLSPALPEAGGPGTASGSLDSTRSGGEDVIQNPLLPNSFPWKWRDVVSEYFRH